jgi:hypothetical protein
MPQQFRLRSGARGQSPQQFRLRSGARGQGGRAPRGIVRRQQIQKHTKEHHRDSANTKR